MFGCLFPKLLKRVRHPQDRFFLSLVFFFLLISCAFYRCANFTCLVFQSVFKQIQIHPMELLLKYEILCLVDVVCSVCSVLFRNDCKTKDFSVPKEDSSFILCFMSVSLSYCAVLPTQNKLYSESAESTLHLIYTPYIYTACTLLCKSQRPVILLKSVLIVKSSKQ